MTLIPSPPDFLSDAPWTPSPEEIAAECLAIQAGWSEQERENRIADDRKRQQTVMPPLIRLTGRMRELAAFD
jgi:hypothetical protein